MNDQVWEKLWRILDLRDEEAIVYVYRLDSHGMAIKPYLLTCEAWPGLPSMLRDEYAGGEFKLLIRKNRTMIFSGKLGIVSSAYKIRSAQ